MFGLNKKEDLSKVEELDKSVKDAFKTVREEMDDHLVAINENTEEQQEMRSHMVDLEAKFEKLKEKVDDMYLMISNLSSQKEFSLSDPEKSVFMVLYSIEQTPLSYSDLVIRTGLTELSVKAHIYSMINKGIPIIERDISGQSFFRLDKKFKELQAKENVLKIDIDEF